MRLGFGQRDKKTEKFRKSPVPTIDEIKKFAILHSLNVAQPPYQGPLRLVAQDIGFSVLVQGFDSPRG